MSDFHALPPGLPVPLDDGAADHLPGRSLPALALAATTGATIDLAEAAADAGTLVLYVYPRTGTPGRRSPDGWDAIPGARGCTPQSCAFRDHHAELGALGAAVLGLSAQPSAARSCGRSTRSFPPIATPRRSPPGCSGATGADRRVALRSSNDAGGSVRGRDRERGAAA